MEDRIYIKEYPYVGITGTVYYPYFYKNKWFLVSGREVSFYHLVYLCQIPDDEALILKLKFGTGITLQPSESVVK